MPRERNSSNFLLFNIFARMSLKGPPLLFGSSSSAAAMCAHPSAVQLRLPFSSHPLLPKPDLLFSMLAIAAFLSAAAPAKWRLSGQLWAKCVGQKGAPQQQLGPRKGDSPPVFGGGAHLPSGGVVLLVRHRLGPHHPYPFCVGLGLNIGAAALAQDH